MELGDKFILTENALENYGESYRDKEFTVSHVATNESEHPGYDAGMKGENLYDAHELEFSVYDYEVIPL